MRRFLSDLNSRKQYAKMYERWRKDITNTYLQTSLDANICFNQKVLRDRSMLDKLVCMSELEVTMLDKINSARFSLKNRNEIVLKNEVQFGKNDIAHERHNAIINEEIKSNMEKEVNKTD